MDITGLRIAAVTVNYKTAELMRHSTAAFRRVYPSMPLVIVDNGSFDDSSEWAFRFARLDGNTRVVFNNFNLNHGPSLHLGISCAASHRGVEDERLPRPPDYVYIFDSDIFLRGPVIEAMLDRVALPGGGVSDFYGVGCVMPNVYSAARYLHPRCALLNARRYFDFLPFGRRLPCMSAMLDIQAKGESRLLIHFDGVDHSSDEWFHHVGNGSHGGKITIPGWLEAG